MMDLVVVTDTGFSNIDTEIKHSPFEMSPTRRYHAYRSCVFGWPNAASSSLSQARQQDVARNRRAGLVNPAVYCR